MATSVPNAMPTSAHDLAECDALSADRAAHPDAAGRFEIDRHDRPRQRMFAALVDVGNDAQHVVFAEEV